MTLKKAQQIIQQATTALLPYARNSRTHSEQQIAQISASIREFGFTNPVLVDDDNGIVAGHGRVMAAQQLGMAEVPTINVGWLTGAQRRAYVIADNQLALNAGWDAEILAHELLDLQGLEFDLSCLGFDAAALAAAMAYMPAAPLENMPGLPDGDRAPFRQMTFTLHDSQEENVTLAINIAKQMGAFVDSPNENSNGNALARICETFITQNGQR